MRPKVIVVGNDALAREVCREFAATHDVREVWEPEEHALRDAGIAGAAAVVAVHPDDRINLDVALEARALNPAVRIVISQFSRGLGAKLEQNLPNCSVISPAAHSGAAFAAAALDPACIYGLEFPEGSGRLGGFVAQPVRELISIAGISVTTAESYLGAPIIACNGRAIDDKGHLLQFDDEIVTYRPIERGGAVGNKRFVRPLFFKMYDAVSTLLREIDPLVQAALLGGILLFAAGTIFFAAVLQLGPVSAAYFVVQTLTTVGYGDVSLLHRPDYMKVADMLLMVGGVVVTNLAVAFLSAALVRTQWISLQGLRRVHASDHVVICGAGRVGTRVMEYLRDFNVMLVIVDRNPSATAVRFGRLRRTALLTGDAVEDETLDLCDIERARSVVVLTDNDAANLEIGLGVRARQAEIPVIMRINDSRFAQRVRAQFGVRSIFSPNALSAPTIAGLADSPGARGRLALDGITFAIEERDAGDALPPDAIVVAAHGERRLLLSPLG
jgi:Trk K+ transport system NAD-binding subunit